MISFGADFLSTWNSPVAQAIGYGELRQGRPGARGKLVQVEPRMSPTGSSADEWIPVRPGTEGVLALGLAHVILAEKIRTPEAAGHAGALLAGWLQGLPDYTPEAVEKLTGVETARTKRLAREITSHSPGIALVGGAPLARPKLSLEVASGKLAKVRDSGKLKAKVAAGGSKASGVAAC